MDNSLPVEGVLPDAISGGSLRVDVVRNLEGFEELRAAWDDLAGRSSADIFQTFDWIHEWWKFFGQHPRRSLHLIIFRLDGTIIGICPSFIERERFLGWTISQELRLMGCGVRGGGYPAPLSALGPSDYLDIIADPRHRPIVLHGLTRHLSALTASGTDIEFEHLSTRSNLANGLQPIPAIAGVEIERAPADTCPRMALPSGMNVFVQKLRPEVRRRVNQAIRASSELYTVREVKSADELESVLDRLIRLHQQRWNSLGYAGLFSDKRFTLFQRTVLRSLYAKGRVWCKYVEMDGTCVAVRIGLRYGKTLYDYLSGFDPQSPASRRRPGIALLLSMMEDGIASKMDTLDFLRGDEEYKFDFADTSNTNIHLTISARKKRSSAGNAARRLAAGIGAAGSLVAKEWVLLRIQCGIHGTAAGIISYTRFRTQRLRARTEKAVELPRTVSGGLTGS